MIKLKKNTSSLEVAMALSGTEGKTLSSGWVQISCPLHQDLDPSFCFIIENDFLKPHCFSAKHSNQKEVEEQIKDILEKKQMLDENTKRSRKKPQNSKIEPQFLDLEDVFDKVDISSKENKKLTMDYLKGLKNWQVASKKKFPLDAKEWNKEEKQNTFEVCQEQLNAYKKIKNDKVSYNFLSFCLFEKQNLVCIDLDDHSNTGKIKEWVQEVTLPKELNLKASDIESYFCELSQSKLGVHIFLKLKKDAIKKVKSLKEPLEVYKENKQICVTSCLDEKMFISPRLLLEEPKFWQSGVFKDLSALEMVNQSYDLLGFMHRLIYYAQGCFKCYLDETLMHFCLYEAGYWKEGKTYALRFIGDVSQKLKEEFNFLETMEQKKDLIRFINKSFSKRFKEDVLQACISENSLKIDDETFQIQTGEDLLNLNNVTFDFSKNEFREQRKDDFLTYKIKLDYDKDSKCDKWQSFLNDVFLGNSELISYVQKLIGYVITGRGNERLFVILNGKGKNGKSVFCDVLIKVLGQYAGTLAKECFIWKKQKTSEINSYLTKALLERTRFLKTSELASNDILDDALVKNVSGCEDVQTRTLRSLPITMKPQFTIFCLTNNLPRVNDYSKGMWDRIKIIPFNASFGDEVGDKKENKQIRKELYKEAQGILNWCIEGFRKYEIEGLKETEEMKALVSEYKKEEDVLQQWIDKKVLFDVSSSENVSVCYVSFCEFLAEQGLNKDEFSQKKFTSQLTRLKGFRVSDDTNTNYKKFRGVKIKNGTKNEQKVGEDEPKSCEIFN